MRFGVHADDLTFNPITSVDSVFPQLKFQTTQITTNLPPWILHIPKKNQILTLNYEDVVAEPEQSIKRLFEYLEIDVEAPCFEFHKTVRAVRTASSEQVRQPINTQGRDQWKHYQPYLTELLELLDD